MPLLKNMKLIKSVDRNFCEIEGNLRAETEKAILFQGDRFQAWIPRSQIESLEIDKHSNVTIIIPDWLARDKGLV